MRFFIYRVRSGQGTLEKSGETENLFQLLESQGIIDYSRIVREFENSWVEKKRKSTQSIIL